ncbi:ABC transporter permease [Herbiconiux sp. SYSU D00978]|uniref:ABC transporter permease n=1 Tax=Herbiconiux sp. SYSU D00978 TaxID=2812562 RepID=UPI0027DDFB90|nr:FtsX-like permease family protein [Herbiconiux sp. SYSU D00978]
MTRSKLRDLASTLLVAVLASAFGVFLLQVSGMITAMIAADDVSEFATVQTMLQALSIVFLLLATYVGSIVTANTVATVVAGRVRTIALMRLLGSSAVAERRAIAKEGLVAGAAGALIGTVLGTAAAWGLEVAGDASGLLEAVPHGWADPVLLVPIVAVVLSTWLAAWAGSRRVLAVTPVQALGGSAERGIDDLTRRPVRTALALGLAVLGLLLLGVGVAVGLLTPLGVLIAFPGGLLAFTGVVLGAHLVMPRALRLIGRAFGSSAAARLAAENALRNPERSTRTTIGLVIGVTLITTLAVAMEGYRATVLASVGDSPVVRQAVDVAFGSTVAVFAVLVGYSAVIAAIGMVNNLSMTVLQRTRELGLLRALGFTRRQIRLMIVAEAAQLTFAAIAVGLLLGIVFGWAGAASLLGSVDLAALVPAVPWPLVAVIAVAAAVLTIAASVTPARRATTVSPVTALAVD